MKHRNRKWIHTCNDFFAICIKFWADKHGIRQRVLRQIQTLIREERQDTSFCRLFCLSWKKTNQFPGEMFMWARKRLFLVTHVMKNIGMLHTQTHWRRRAIGYVVRSLSTNTTSPASHSRAGPRSWTRCTTTSNKCCQTSVNLLLRWQVCFYNIRQYMQQTFICLLVVVSTSGYKL